MQPIQSDVVDCSRAKFEIHEMIYPWNPPPWLKVWDEAPALAADPERPPPKPPYLYKILGQYWDYHFFKASHLVEALG